ncbi:hypothetical protein AAY86_16095 [Pseudomonas amygdali pv. tabaci str. ATCC 11528]|nr:hypothetical protein C1E_0202725 [Pseudomonas amygdali pv. tabaci str. ATCC 11528]KKY51890.1 hypothetical protein AAY86_16095 [Pseudomonas amygdali pv. tabaci str. ATCC 11528]KKY60159.1 hypothetical protein AAY85_04115 [Pseudomonas amygdali pv. lachrymans]
MAIVPTQCFSTAVAQTTQSATLILVPTLRVVMHFVTLRVTPICDSVRFRLDSSHLFAPRRVTLMGPK